ncbi:hypothetical protein GCM10010468_15620 [Actinocorallia longicatena]|uniref:Uncharacterized protein n=1 Tax=Actinocorallia longicatena TaxID=111803 RepID=A0ABP6Q3R8_9ACTN
MRDSLLPPVRRRAPSGPPRRPAVPPWRRRRARPVAAALVLALAVGAGWAFAGEGGVRTVKVRGGAVVTAKVAAGTLRAVELEETPELAGATALGRPIQVAPVRLDGPARISFPVPAVPGADPAQDAGIAMRSDGTGDHWTYVGGEYDPATRRISVETTHFSQWMPVLRDVAGLATAVSGYLRGLLGGGVPAVDCRGDLRGTPVADPVGPRLTACLSASGELQIANPHGFPVNLFLPAGVSAAAGNAPQSAGQGLWVPAVERLRRGTVLLPNAKRVFHVDVQSLGKGTPSVVGDVDVATFVFDLAAFLADRVLPLDLSGKGPPVKATEGLMDCVRRTADALQDRPDVRAFLDGLGTLIRTCYWPEAKALAEATIRKYGVRFQERALSFLIRPLDVILHLPAYVDTAREVLSTAKILDRGDYHPVVLLAPGLDPRQADALTDKAPSGDCGLLGQVLNVLPFVDGLLKSACGQLLRFLHLS